MNKFLCILFVASLALASCNEKNNFESLAKDTFKKTYYDRIEDDKNVSVENIKTVYSNDSLCILHVDIKGVLDDVKLNNGVKLEINHKLEYVLYSYEGKLYDGYHSLDDDSVFVSKATLDKISKGTITENLDYDIALLYRSVMYLNSNGKEVGNPDADFYLPIPTGTGLWELDAYVDEFGDKTSDKYLRLRGRGTFSNSAATNEKLVVYLFTDKDTTSTHFRFVEYGSSVVKNEDICYMKIKDSYGDIHEIKFYCNENGNLFPAYYDENAAKELRGIIGNEGEISVSAEMDGGYSKSKYKFKLKLDGFKKALELI